MVNWAAETDLRLVGLTCASEPRPQWTEVVLRTLDGCDAAGLGYQVVLRSMHVVESRFRDDRVGLARYIVEQTECGPILLAHDTDAADPLVAPRVRRPGPTTRPGSAPDVGLGVAGVSDPNCARRVPAMAPLLTAACRSPAA